MLSRDVYYVTEEALRSCPLIGYKATTRGHAPKLTCPKSTLVAYELAYWPNVPQSVSYEECKPAFAGHGSLPPRRAYASVLMWQAWQALMRLENFDMMNSNSVGVADPLPNLTDAQNNSLFTTYCKIPRRGCSKLQLFVTYLLLITSTYC